MRYYWYISLPFNCSIIKGQAYWKIRSATPLQTFFIFFPSIEWTDHPSCAPSLTFAGPRLRLSRCSSWWWRYPEAWVQSDPICSKLPETSSSEPYTVNYHVAWIQNHKPSSRILYIVDYIYIHYIYIIQIGFWRLEGGHVGLQIWICFHLGRTTHLGKRSEMVETITWPLDGCFLR